MAFANIDCDLYSGAMDALHGLRSRLCVGTRLHFHEFIKGQLAKGRKLARGDRSDNVIAPCEEARALYDWLRAPQQEGVELQLSNAFSRTNSQAAAFTVRRPGSAGSALCAGGVDA